MPRASILHLDPRRRPSFGRTRIVRRLATLLVGAAVLLLVPASGSVAASPPDGTRIVGWNDLGMHCMDRDFSVFSPATRSSARRP